MKNILIVDDEQYIFEFFKFNFRKEGYNIFEVDSGVLVLEILKYNKVDFVIFDIMMSDKDGYEVLKEI